MSHSAELHVVLGGTGGVGSAVVDALVAQGKTVRIVSRSGKGAIPGTVTAVAARLQDPTQAREACAGASHIYFCSNPDYTRWQQEFPPLLEGTIAAAQSTGAKLIVADNLYMYPRTAKPLTEDLPWQPTSRKGKVRKAMDERLFAEHQAGRIRMTIGRASDFFGPNAPNTSTIGERFFAAYLTGKPVDWVGKLNVLHTFSYVKDVGRGLVTLGANDRALGEAWHIPAAPAITSQEFLDMVFEAGGKRVKVNTASGTMLSMIGIFSPILREVAEMAYEFEEPFVMDATKYANMFGSQYTPLRDAIRETVAWFTAHQPVQA